MLTRDLPDLTVIAPLPSDTKSTDCPLNPPTISRSLGTNTEKEKFSSVSIDSSFHIGISPSCQILIVPS